MVFEFLQAAAHKSHKHSSLFRHLGPFGLLLLAVLDGSPVPTFGGPDILTAVLAATHRTPWYECAAMATVGSAFGAYLTFRMARHAGSAYLNSKFGNGKLPGLLKLFQRWGMGALAVSAPFPSLFPRAYFSPLPEPRTAARASFSRSLPFAGARGIRSLPCWRTIMDGTSYAFSAIPNATGAGCCW